MSYAKAVDTVKNINTNNTIIDFFIQSPHLNLDTY